VGSEMCIRDRPETMQLMRDMVAAGEVDALVAERVWQEFAKGLMEREPRKMIEVLRDCGALAILLPEVEALFGVPQRADYHPEVDSGEHTLLVLQCAADLNLSLAERYAALLHDLGKTLTPHDVLPKHIGHDRRGVEPIRAVNQRWRVPKHCAELAELVCAFHIRFHQIGQIKQASKIIKLLKECDAFRRPERVQAALNVCLADQQGRLGKQNSPYPQREHIMALIAAAQQINAGEIAQQYAKQPAQISEKIDEARAMQVKALQAAFREKMTEH
ncbi:HD domain-containing protein, partial [Kingella kingae]|uniref:HD domain-containing protein n=1 Tax=Kingella kingae TaxID=504 RepID=UPI00255486D0